MARRRSSVAADYNASIRERTASVAVDVRAHESWLESKIKPRKVTARYPIKGAALLYATCGFGSLGDALFGYNSGTLVGCLSIILIH